MTGPRTPPPDDREPVDPDVALASAHVDGELDESAQARIAVDPAAAALAVRLAAIAHEVRDVPPPPAELVDAQVAAALAAMDDGLVADGPPAAVPLDRPRRAGPERSWWQRVPLGAVAAAVAVVALVGAIGLASRADDDDHDTAATVFDSADGGSDGGDEAVEAEDDTGALEAAPFGSSGSGATSAPRPTYGDYDELVAALDAAPTTTAAGAADQPTDQPDEADERGEGTSDEGVPPIDPCGAVGVLGLEHTDIEQVLPVMVGGDPVTAVVHLVDGERRVSVVDDARCTPTLEGVLLR